MVYTVLGVFTRELTAAPAASLATSSGATFKRCERCASTERATSRIPSRAPARAAQRYSDVRFGASRRSTRGSEGDPRGRDANARIPLKKAEGKSLVDAMRDSALDGMQHFDGELEKLVRSPQPAGFLPADEPLTMDFRVTHQTAHSVTMI